MKKIIAVSGAGGMACGVGRRATMDGAGAVMRQTFGDDAGGEKRETASGAPFRGGLLRYGAARKGGEQTWQAGGLSAWRERGGKGA